MKRGNDAVSALDLFVVGYTKVNIEAGSDFGLPIKRRLLLGRRALTNLDSGFKSRDITLLTKVHIVKAVVFPVVMFRCESWTIKKAECGLMPLNCGVGEDS